MRKIYISQGTVVIYLRCGGHVQKINYLKISLGFCVLKIFKSVDFLIRVIDAAQIVCGAGSM